MPEKLSLGDWGARLIAVWVVSSLCWHAGAQTVPVSFTGSGEIARDGWSEMTFSRLGTLNYGTWPGSKEWTQPIFANTLDSAGLLNRLANSPNGGGPYPSDESLYFGSGTTVPNTLGGTLGVSRAPVPGVRTIVFQIELGQGEAGYFFHEPPGSPSAGHPTLYINGQLIPVPTFTATVNQRVTGGGGETGEDPVFVDTYAYQWNTDVAAVASIEIRFSCVEHASIYSMRLDQTSVLQSSNVFDAGSAEPVISLSGTGLAAGDVVVGSGKTGTLTISNTGNSPLNIAKISYPRGFSGETGGNSIPSGGSRNVIVTFTPDAVGNFVGAISVDSDATEGENTIPVSGTGFGPAIRAHVAGTPQYDGAVTSVTHTFLSTPATWLNLEFTDNLIDGNGWTPHSEIVYSDEGEFSVTFRKPGDHRIGWRRGLFFRLSYPTKP